jgi:hypothetical protein
VRATHKRQWPELYRHMSAINFQSAELVNFQPAAPAQGDPSAAESPRARTCAPLIGERRVEMCDVRRRISAGAPCKQPARCGRLVCSKELALLRVAGAASGGYKTGSLVL